MTFKKEYRTAVHEINLKRSFTDDEINQVENLIGCLMEKGGIKSVVQGKPVFDGRLIAFIIGKHENGFYLDLKRPSIELVRFSDEDSSILGFLIIGLHYIAPTAITLLDTPFDQEDWLDWAGEVAKYLPVDPECEYRFMTLEFRMKSLLMNLDETVFQFV